MNHTRKFFLTVLLSCAALPLTTEAKKRNSRDLSKRQPPKTVLVMLFTEENRRQALVKAHRYRDTAILNKDMRSVQEVTVKDFTNNFDFCPVYFFMDEDLDKVVNGQFGGTLLDKDMHPANVNMADTNYLIVYYGFPGWQSHEKRMEVTTLSDVGGKPNGWGLVVNNHEMRQVGYTYWLRSVNLKKRGKIHGYKYISPKFDIEYSPLAGELNSRLKKYATRQGEAQAEK
ncbi:hypothetical protein GCM10023093_25030 [Nemorincola caseinilytica]|uniref:Uncharacterized protein n=1 Tax=Nemorincola caseinilytica TaxID=2054315 RepID=A0ABP8NMI4_9BACT